MAKFTPRQRKHKVLARERAKENQRQEPIQDTNEQELLPEHQRKLQEKKAELKAELRKDGVKVSSKKAKRLENYIDKKLQKDENRELLAKLAETKIDTSLFTSTRSIGQGKETKKQALSRALREERSGFDFGDSKNEILFEKREVRELSPTDDNITPEESWTVDAEVGGRVALAESDPPIASVPQSLSLQHVVAGSGLKRPLELGSDGRPMLQKRQKRGGVESKLSFGHPDLKIDEEEYEEEWDGFSSDENFGKARIGSADQMASDEEGSDSEEESASSQQSGSGEMEDDSDSEDEDEDDDGGDDGDDDNDQDEYDNESDDGDGNAQAKERSSAFKAWALEQRNEALGYQTVTSDPSILDIPKPDNFVPREVEQEPLPTELQQTINVDRKSYSVSVSRTADIQEARLKLPVVAEEQKVMEAIHNHDTVVVCGATGSGKTTQVPQFLYEAGYGSPDSPTPGLIGVTQPRRVAAVSMSKRVADELGDHSKAVAYQIRFEGNVDPSTAIKFMTDGVLLREVAQDISLKKYSAIIIDEAHERSVNTDILIGMLSRVIKLRRDLAKEDPSIRPLKLIIMSATLRIEDMTQNQMLFSIPPPVVEVEGRQHQVTIHFSRRTQHDYVEEAYRKIIRGHKKLPPGGFLVFLTGQSEILQLSKKLRSAFSGLNSVSGPKVQISAREAPMEVEDIEFGDFEDRQDGGWDALDSNESGEEDEDDEFELEEEEITGPPPLKMQILPLYSLLPTREQLRVFEPTPEGTRQIILATNVAETSITIPGTRFVFDCGRSKERKFDRETGIQSYEIGWISKASASQRAGRAGRTGPGHCYRLYSSAVYERDFSQFADPELLRMPIEGVVLQLKSMNLQHVINFPFPTPPQRQSLVKAEKLLTYLSALSPTGQVTQVGSTMSIFPLAPRFARILLVGYLHDCIHYTIALVAGLSAPDFYVPENHAIPALAERDESTLRSNSDILAENKQAELRRAFNAAHRNFCFLDDKSDAIKLLQVVGEYAHEPTEDWCENHFVRHKILKEIQQLRRQIVELLKSNIPAFANLKFQDKIDPPSSKQVSALKQMVAAGFIDQVAIRADLSPTPPDLYRKPRRAIEVPYIPLMPIDTSLEENSDGLVYLHPNSPLAHLSLQECPEYVVYSYLQRASALGQEAGKKPKTRLHALTDITGAQLASLAKGTPLISYGKPIKEVKSFGGSTTATERECWVIPYLRAENAAGQGWPLPAKKVKQKKILGKGWIVE
jgi:ATP-dependent RNA helicase DHX37/DHR1